MGKNFSKNNTGNRNKDDFYETPFSMTESLFEKEIFDKDKTMLEPACGHLAITKIASKHIGSITSEDLNTGKDFLSLFNNETYDYIITNPPYKFAMEFILKSKQIARYKIAMLLPLDYLHGIERYFLFQDIEFSLKKVLVFARRPMLGDPLREDGKYRTGMQTYAWFIWDKYYLGPPTISWIDNQKYVLKAGE
jgi:hypothetical protein